MLLHNNKGFISPVSPEQDPDTVHGTVKGIFYQGFNCTCCGLIKYALLVVYISEKQKNISKHHWERVKLLLAMSAAWLCGMAVLVCWLVHCSRLNYYTINYCKDLL